MGGQWQQPIPTTGANFPATVQKVAMLRQIPGVIVDHENQCTLMERREIQAIFLPCVVLAAFSAEPTEPPTALVTARLKLSGQAAWEKTGTQIMTILDPATHWWGCNLNLNDVLSQPVSYRRGMNLTLDGYYTFQTTSNVATTAAADGQLSFFVGGMEATESATLGEQQANVGRLNFESFDLTGRTSL